VRSYPSGRVPLVASVAQCGKSSIHNQLVARSWSEIIVFTEADSRVNFEGLRRMVENFGYREKGFVTISPAYSNPDETDLASNESLYWRL
jgi:hypothetical protein